MRGIYLLTRKCRVVSDVLLSDSSFIFLTLLRVSGLLLRGCAITFETLGSGRYRMSLKPDLLGRLG